LKILLCHNFYQQTGGEDVAVMALKELLEQKGHDVIFYSENSREIGKYSAFQKIAFFPQAVFSARTYRNIQRIAKQERPDLAHVHNVFPLISPALYVALSRAGIPIVQTVHNFRLMCINGLFLRDGRICELCKSGNFLSGVRYKCYRNSYTLSGLYAATIGSHRSAGTFDRVDRFVALSQFAASKLVESGLVEMSKISVVENFLPQPVPGYGQSDVANPYIVYVGRLSQEKGIFTLLEALRGLTRLRLKILGVGPLRDRIENVIDTLGLQNVDMLGFLEGEKKYDLLRNAICCVVPSECYETFGFPIIESAAVGTPVVASRIGSLAKLVAEGETGLLFDPGNTTDLREKLKMLLDNPETAIRMGQAARQWVMTNHSPDVHYERLMRIYEEVRATTSKPGLLQTRAVSS
jgi:glycosyltransferase involved in cell wall biosynthesis